jgi:hypothetical protein
VDLGVVDPRKHETLLIRSATDDDIIDLIVGGIAYAVLAHDHGGYIQCAARDEPPPGFWLSYCEGVDGVILYAQDPTIELGRVLPAFLKYRRGDASWKSEFTWGILGDGSDV